MTQQMGNVAARSYQSFMINDHLLAKCVNAVQEGEKKARQSGQIQSFEVFTEGFRQHLIIGRIMIVPPTVADSIDDFPVALLYGAIVREFGGEEISDLMEHKIGEGDFDEYSKADYQEIKERLFKNPDTGKFDCLVMFLPAWTNPREYLTFRYVKNDIELANLLRHLVFCCYFDPALSSAFEQLMSDIDTTKVDVTDITPNLQYPFLSENPLKQYPDLKKGDEGKTASARKPYAVLNYKTAGEINLEDGELQVIAELTKDFEAKGEGITPMGDVAQTTIKEPEGIRRQPDYGEPGSYTSDANKANEKGAASTKCPCGSGKPSYLQQNEEGTSTTRMCPDCKEEKLKKMGKGAAKKKADMADNPANEAGGDGAICPKTDADISKTADTADNPANEAGGDGVMLPKTDKDKPKTANIYPDRDAKYKCLDCGNWCDDNKLCSVCENCEASKFEPLPNIKQGAATCKCGHPASSHEGGTGGCNGKQFPDGDCNCEEYRASKKADGAQGPGGAWTSGRGGTMLTEPAVQDDAAAISRLKTMSVKRLEQPSPAPPKKRAAVEDELDIFDNSHKLVATQNAGMSSKRAAELSAREAKLDKMRNNGVNGKVAEVNTTFDSIWNDITEDIGPAPLVDVPEAPQYKAKSAPKKKETETTSEAPAAPKEEKKSPAPKKPESDWSYFYEEEEEHEEESEDHAKGQHEKEKEDHAAEVKDHKKEKEEHEKEPASKKGYWDDRRPGETQQEADERISASEAFRNQSEDWRYERDRKREERDKQQGRKPVNAGWEDGYWKGPLKDGYPPTYFDENNTLQYPWQKDEQWPKKEHRVNCPANNGDRCTCGLVQEEIDKVRGKQSGWESQNEDTAKRLSGDTGTVTDSKSLEEDHTGIKYPATVMPSKFAAGEPQVGHVPFAGLLAHKKDLGLVVTGAGEPHQEWVDGIAGMLVQEGICQAPVFSDAFVIDGNVAGSGGRTDLAMIFSPASKPDVGKLAMWRINFGDVSWIDDFIDNYGKDYGAAGRDDHMDDSEEDQMLSDDSEEDWEGNPIPPRRGSVDPTKLAGTSFHLAEAELGELGENPFPVETHEETCPQCGQGDNAHHNDSCPMKYVNVDGEGMWLTPEEFEEFWVKEQSTPPGTEEELAATPDELAHGVQFASKKAVAPPGKEDVVKALKKEPGVDNPWAIAWSQYDKEHSKEAAVKLAAFTFMSPVTGPALQTQYPDLAKDMLTGFPNPTPNQANSPMIQDIGVDDSALYVSTAPTGIGISVKPNPVGLEGNSEHKFDGYDFMEQYHDQLGGAIPGSLFASQMVKKAAKSDAKAQFGKFLKLVVGEIAASFIAAFKVTMRPIMSKVPGDGSINLDMIEQPMINPAATTTSGSRMRMLVGDLNDSDIQEIINQAWASSAVWNDDPKHGYVYEVFVRAESLDKDSLILKYTFITGTKEAETVVL